MSEYYEAAIRVLDKHIEVIDYMVSEKYADHFDIPEDENVERLAKLKADRDVCVEAVAELHETGSRYGI